MEAAKKAFDYIVIGAGSGGMASARRAAKYGKKVAVIENKRIGGTCVNVGCVPKKIMFCGAALIEDMHLAHHYGITFDNMKLDWAKLKERRDAFVAKLNGIYDNNFKKEGVEYVQGTASFVDNKTVDVNGEHLTAPHILIATGSTPRMPNIPGGEFAINSDGFFDLEECPKVATVAGSGYIAVELAGVLNEMGAKVNLVLRRDTVLTKFDTMISDFLKKEMTKAGVNLVTQSTIASIAKNDEGAESKFTVGLNGDRSIQSDVVLYAIGRSPLIEGLNLDKAGVEIDPTNDNCVKVDEFQNTSVEGIYSLGDVCGKAPLTPVAIAAGRKLSERIFNGKTDLKMDYTEIPSVVFSHPTVGSIGYTEDEAKAKFGEENIKTYKSSFRNLWYAVCEEQDKQPTSMKLICEGENERVVGLHGIGRGVDEIIQGFGVAIKMGATKADFDSCVAIHPTSAEEYVTMT